jgi:hypothetical protein
VVGHVRPFGLRRTWAVCRCGHRSRLVEGQDSAAHEAAIELLVSEHGARRDPDGVARADYEGGSGPFRPGPPAP